MFLRRSFLFAFAAFSGVAYGAGNDFQMASQLLGAARNGDQQAVETLVKNGANVNYKDKTGISIVCTAIMNNDMNAAQVLQKYGADASNCDQQIKQYKSTLPKTDNGGMLSGLSNAQSMTLTAGGAALAAGGVYLVGDQLFGSGKGNSNSSSNGGDRPSTGDNTGGTTDTATALFAVGYGPAQWNTTTQKVNSSFDLSTEMAAYSGTGTMNALGDFAYMSSGGRQNYLLINDGYAALARGYTGEIVARNSSNNPVTSASLMLPITVALVTANGVNPSGTAMDQEICLNRDEVTGCGTADLYHRYKNIETGSENSAYDYSRTGTVFNTSATAEDSLLAKIVVGGTAAGDTRTSADFIGYMPNGQLVLYRTGDGRRYIVGGDKGLLTTILSGTTIVIDGIPYTIDGTTNYLGPDNHYYINGNEYAIQNGHLWQLQSQPYRNYEAMRNAYILLGKDSIIANAALIDPMKSVDTPGIGTIIASSNKAADFLGLVDYYYYNDTNAATADMLNIFTGGNDSKFIIFSSGEYKIDKHGGTSWDTQFATFENAAPILSTNLNHHFMTSVAVQYTGGTGVSSTTTDVHGGKYVLSGYDADGNSATTNDLYGARACGIAGTGYSSNVDPWCFASPGVTGEEAVASLAGATGVTLGAFTHYMSTEQVFYLLALTADGKYYSQSELAAMYSLPADIAGQLPATTDDTYAKKWMDLFKETFGYGLVNLDRATKPGEKLYFYSTNSTKTGYWSSTPSANRAATTLKLSSALGARASTISLAMFDFVSSSDGTESMPRIFSTDFQLDTSVHGLNLSDLMDEVSFDDPQKINKSLTTQLNLSDDNQIKDLSVNYDGDGFSLSAQYLNRKRNVTFSTDNPYWALAGNSLETQMTMGNFGFSVMNGSITDQGLLETDPALTNSYTAATIGEIYGFDSFVKYGALKLSAGYMNENDTTLGTQSSGLFDMGGGKTIYTAAELRLGNVVANYTIGRTTTNPGFGYISDVSALYSDSYSLSANFGKWMLQVSRPLAVIDGTLSYVNANYDIVDSSSGYDLNLSPYIDTISMVPPHRETRFALLYQPEISERTKLAFGLVERVNPNNTQGHEEILMMKFRRLW